MILQNFKKSYRGGGEFYQRGRNIEVCVSWSMVAKIVDVKLRAAKKKANKFMNKSCLLCNV